MRRYRSGQERDAVEIERGARRTCHTEMTEVNRVERAAKQAVSHEGPAQPATGVAADTCRHISSTSAGRPSPVTADTGKSGTCTASR